MTNKLFIFGYATSILGNGLVYPFIILFLTDILHMTATGGSYYFALTGASSMLAGLLSAYLVTKFNFMHILGFGVSLQAIGGMLLAGSGTAISAYCSGILLGLGNGFFFAVQTVLFVHLFGKERIGEIFSLQLVIMNIAVAVAGVCGGILVEGLGETGYRIAFLFNGISFAIYGLVLKFLSKDIEIPKKEIIPSEKRQPLLSQIRRKDYFIILRLIIMQLLISATAFSQMDTVYPVSITKVPYFSVLYVSAFLVINGVAVVLLQKLGLKICRAIGYAGSIKLAAAIWAVVFGASWLVFNYVSSFWLSTCILILASIGFAFAEVLEAPSFQPLIVESVPSNALGSVTSLVSTFYSLGLFIGPLITLPLLEHGTGGYAWLFLVISQIFLLLIAASFHSSLGRSRSAVS
ncbi:MFS transporter [Corynebacterium casei]|uniref:Putative MFS superfamily transporter n=1 Tax=Corynebacterium casei UCMA 3821 TaxID=1110505 RepID=G7HWI7_9CORY|nr:MFS transporter [Corynebacterium casei]CCE54552.1 putative MFS superfamily transporter [Corynebacterium casei UCMA 3821]